MATESIKKSLILKKDLPEFSGATGKYKLRYRVISEDRNRISYWSKIHDVSVPSVTQLTSSQYTQVVQEITQPGNKKVHVVQLWWTPNSTYLFNNYDVYIATNTSGVAEPLPSSYSYSSRISTPLFSQVFDSTIDNFSIIIHSPTYDKIINTSQILIKTPKYVI